MIIMDYGIDLMTVALPKAMYLETQIPVITEILNEGGLEIDEDLVSQLMSGQASVKLSEDGLPEKITVTRQTLGRDDYVYGTTAIKYLLERFDSHDTVMEKCVYPVTKVNITSKMFEVCSPTVWWDITKLFFNLKNRVKKYERMIELECPIMITWNEERLVWEKLQLLNTNTVYGDKVRTVQRPNDTVCRSLHDIGYALGKGWEEYMIERFEKAERKFEEDLQTVLEQAQKECGD